MRETPDDRPVPDGDRLEQLGTRLEVISVVLEIAREELAKVRTAEATPARTARSSSGRRDRHGLRAL
ncbi:hypothetical protein ACFO9E_13370 [Streptomyces maoxianensis]|uniref:Uncharacterized protein n=1 Tax=Streptomyces maoxianensis TaxID=1459942 RepID=A0ABV9G6T8_9ACTN